jgi:hypothetical protein
MVNGWLKSPLPAAGTRPMSAKAAKRAHFRHENCVNQQASTRLGALRSRFGSTDSWSIN